MTTKGKRRSVVLRVARWSLGFLALLVVVGVIVLRIKFNGAALGSFVEAQLNDRIRGRLEISSIEWDLSDLPKVVSGGWVPITAYDVKLYDDYGRLVIETDKLTAKIDAHAAMFGHHDLVFRDVAMPDGGWALIRLVEEPYPIHEYDENVVSILSAFYSKKSPSIYAGLSAAPAAVIDVRNFDLPNIKLEFEFDYFHGHVEDGHLKGFIYADDSDPLSRKLYYSVTGQAAAGRIVSEQGDIPLRDVAIHQLEQLPKKWPRDPYASDVEWNLTAKTTDGGELSLDGAMLDYWQDYFGGDYEAHLALVRGGSLASSLSDGLASGDDLRLDAFVDGPVLAPRVALQLADVELALPISESGPPLALRLETAAAGFDLATEEGYLERTSLIGAGGELQLSATFSLEPRQFDLHLAIPRAIEMRPYLPPDVARLAGTKLRGRLHAFGTTDAQRIDDLHLWLGRAHLQGELFREKGQIIHANELRISMGQTLVTARRSWVDGATRTFDLLLDFSSRDAARYLRYFGAPEVASRVNGKARVDGSFDDPRVIGSVSAGGVPLVSTVNARMSYHRDVLDISDATSSQLGGSLRANAKVQLGPEPRVLAARVDARELDLARSPLLARFASGIASGHFEAKGPLSRLTARGDASIAGLRLGGDDYRTFNLSLQADGDGSQSLSLEAERNDGGSLLAAVTRDRHDNLGGALTLRALPIESLGFLADTPQDSPVGGIVEAEVSLSGTLDAPTADGTITLVRTWFSDAFLGAADLDIRRAGDGLLAVDGHLFQGKLAVSGTVETRAPFRTLLTIDARRVELDHFVPSLVEEQQMRGWFSGTIALDTELLPLPGHKPKASMRLTELTLLREAIDLDGRPAPITLRNKSVVDLDWDGAQAVLRNPAIFAGPAGDITVTGSASPDALALKVNGDIAVTMLQPYLNDYFSRTSGVVHARVNVRGAVASPEISGRFDFDQVTITPIGQDATVSIPQGVLTIEEKQVAITDIIVRVDDPETKERTELKIWGGVRMKHWVPESWTVNVRGHLAGKMLLAAAPSVFSQAGGTAYLAMKLEGDGKVPDNLDGSLWFACPRQGGTNDGGRFGRGQVRTNLPDQDISDDPFNDDLEESIESACDIKQPLSFMARGLRRQLMFTTGHVALKRDRSNSSVNAKHRLVLHDIGGWLDEEGLFENVNGFVAFDDWKLDSYEVTASAQAVPLRIPKTLDLTVSVPELAIAGTAETLSIAGDVEIIDGRYIRKFNLVSGFLTPERTSEAAPPFYETIPLLANAKLALRLETRAFFVENNIANVGLNGGLTLGGTPLNPRLDGVINVEQGTFKMPGMRATFTRTGGSVTFSQRQSFPEDTPNLDIKSEADFRDSSGQEHVIHLELTGTLDNFNFNLYTDTGLNKGQTLTLISSGRTADDLRQSLGDDAIGRDPTRLDTGDGTAGTVYDEILKDLAGDFISLLIEDRIRDITKLDVARLEIGTTSVGFHLEKDLFENFRLTGDLQKNLRGWQWNARGELRMSDGFSVEGEWLQLNQTDDAEEDKSEGRLRAVWRKGWQ